VPVLKVWEVDNVIVFEHSMTSGYAGIANALLCKSNAKMLFGDAKDKANEILRALHR
jgi:NAD(P) transhydrogenase subunit beta